MKGQENLIRSIHPSDESIVDYIGILRVRCTLKDYEELTLNVIRGVLKYALREEDNPRKNIVHLRRFAVPLCLNKKNLL